MNQLFDKSKKGRVHLTIRMYGGSCLLFRTRRRSNWSGRTRPHVSGRGSFREHGTRAIQRLPACWTLKEGLPQTLCEMRCCDMIKVRLAPPKSSVPRFYKFKWGGLVVGVVDGVWGCGLVVWMRGQHETRSMFNVRIWRFCLLRSDLKSSLKV